MTNKETPIKIGVIIPTCDRYDNINYWITSEGKNFDSYGIDLVIYDSSSDDRIELLIKNYRDTGLSRLIYKRYTGIFDGVSLDHKVLAIYQEYIELYDYIWVCRDGIIININTIYNDLLQLFQLENDILVVQIPTEDTKKIGSRNYTDCYEFFRDWFMDTTVLGLLIFSTKILRSIINEIPLDNKTYGFYPTLALFYYIEHHAFRAVSFVSDVYTINPCSTGNSFWNKSGKAFWYFTERWYNIIRLLPAVYDKAKPIILKKEKYDNYLFSLESLFIIRGNNALSIRSLNKYKRYIPFVTDVPLWHFYFISLFPLWLVQYICNSRNKFIKKCFYKCLACINRFFNSLPIFTKKHKNPFSRSLS